MVEKIKRREREGCWWGVDDKKKILKDEKNRRVGGGRELKINISDKGKSDVKEGRLAEKVGEVVEEAR